MKIIFIALVALLFLLQYQLWLSDGGLLSVMQLKHQISVQKEENEKLKERNSHLLADIEDLKKGSEAAEERARHDLGMVKKGETFYQTVPGSN
ncbi:MAG TPA: cell division protein FtsB [Coxiellaceae bacterium]|nr:cell division protein FtsB [Coxiellaceae bacterium]